MADGTRSSKLLKILVPLVVVLVVAVAVGVWFLFIREDDPPAKSSVDETGQEALDCGTATAPESVDGEWSVAEGCGSYAGLRITESFANGLKDHVAVGRSEAVTGSITVAGTEISTASFTVDLTQLQFTDDPGLPVGNRSNAMKNKGLETDEFPDATFDLTEPIDLGSLPADGKTVTVPVQGELTLHGVTKPVEFDLQALLAGDTIQLAATDVAVTLADYDITKPEGGFIAAIDDAGVFEFEIFLQQA